MTTGDEIRAAREAAGLTQAQLAQLVGVSMRTIGNWERGETVSRNRLTMLKRVLASYVDTVESEAPLRSATDAELLAEIARRFARGHDEKAGGEHDQRSAPRTPAGTPPANNVTTLTPPDQGEHIDVTGMAARPGTADHAEGEEGEE